MKNGFTVSRKGSRFQSRCHNETSLSSLAQVAGSSSRASRYARSAGDSRAIRAALSVGDSTRHACASVVSKLLDLFPVTPRLLPHRRGPAEHPPDDSANTPHTTARTPQPRSPTPPPTPTTGEFADTRHTDAN